MNIFENEASIFCTQLMMPSHEISNWKVGGVYLFISILFVQMARIVKIAGT